MNTCDWKEVPGGWACADLLLSYSKYAARRDSAHKAAAITTTNPTKI